MATTATKVQPDAEEAPEGTTETVEAGEPEVKVEEDVVEEKAPETGEGDADTTSDVDAEIREFLKPYTVNEDEYDVVKIAKSALEAQRLVGRTAKDRERLKRIPDLEKKEKTHDAIAQLYQNDVEVRAALDRAWERARGKSVPAASVAPKTEPAVSPEDAEKTARDLMAKGHMAQAVAVAFKASPEFKAWQQEREDLTKTRQELADERRRIQEEAAQVEARKELEVFRGKWGKVLYDEDGEVKDQELHAAWQDGIVKNGLSYEDALLLGLAKLGRAVEHPKDNPAKRQAMTLPKGTTTQRNEPEARQSGPAVWGMTEDRLLKALDRIS